jgi:hypothetical protein
MLALWTTCAFGQEVLSARAGLISYLGGAVYSDQRLENGVQLREGQTLRTEMGRAEVLLGVGSVLRLGEGGSLQMENTQLTDTKVVLEQGSALVEVTQLIKDTRLRVYFRDTTVEFARPGLYRLDASLAQMRIYGGEAAVSDAHRKTRVKRGQAVALSAALAVSKFDLKTDLNTHDALHQWAARRSFDLVNVPELIWRQRRWQPTNKGGLWNKNFGMEFLSEGVAHEMLRRKEEPVHGQGAAVESLPLPPIR